MDKDNQFEKLRKRKFEEIKEIILNSDLTAEEIYEKIKSINPDIMKTEKITNREQMAYNVIIYAIGMLPSIIAHCRRNA